MAVLQEFKCPCCDGAIEFEAYIEQGFHLYSTDIPEGGPTPMEVTYSVVEGAEIVGALQPGDGAVTEMDQMFEMMVSYFSESAVFTQKVKFLGGKYRIKGTLRFQSCSDSNCVPGRYDFDITGETVVEKPAVKEEAKAEPVVKKEEKTAVQPVKKETPKPVKKVEEPAKKEVVAEPVAEVTAEEVVEETATAEDGLVVEADAEGATTEEAPAEETATEQAE